jgi:hypothetical protein
MFSPPLPFCTGDDNHHHLQKKKKNTSFGSSSLFLDLLSFGFTLSCGSLFFFCLLQVIDLAVG